MKSSNQSLILETRGKQFVKFSLRKIGMKKSGFLMQLSNTLFNMASNTKPIKDDWRQDVKLEQRSALNMQFLQ